MFYLLLGLGLLIRFLLIPLAGFKADIAFWKGWGLAVADKGIVWLVNNTNYNYPPGFGYVLWVVNKTYNLFRNAHTIDEYWLDGNIFYLFIFKILIILADLLIVWLILKISRVILTRALKNVNDISAKNIDRIGKILALSYFLNPAVIYDGVVWGQVDQFGIGLFILAFYLVWQHKPNWGAAIFTIACMMKFQNIIFIPLFFLFIYRQYSLEAVMKSLMTAAIAFIGIVFPFFLAHQMDTIIRLIVINADWFPWYSLNAFNIWWIFSGLKGMEMVDKHLFVGILSAKQVGFYFFIFFYFISCVIMLFSKKDDAAKNFVVACMLAVFAFFHVLTQSHERYLFPVMGLFPVYLLLDWSNKSHRSYKNHLIFYFVTSIFFFFNMYLSMGWNYPDQVIPAFTKEGTVGFSLIISIAQTIIFFVFIWMYLRISLIKHIRLIGFMGILIVGAMLFKHVPYILKKPISLTSFKPVGISQEYLSPIYDKTVESNRGTDFWNRLSINYFFYEKGIGSHADSHITYHLNKQFSTFRTDYGLDTESDVNAKVYFTILGDGRVLFKSEEKGRFDSPSSKTVDIRGVNYLNLVITKAGASNFGAHADWLNPVVIR